MGDARMGGMSGLEKQVGSSNLNNVWFSRPWGPGSLTRPTLPDVQPSAEDTDERTERRY